MDSAYTGYALQATATGVTMSALPTTVTNAYKWQLEYEPYPGTPMIRNLSTNTYLCVYESALTLKSMGDLSGTTDYYNAFWRVVPVADQLLPTEVTLSGNTAFELGGFTVLNTVENSDDVFYGNNSDYVWTTSNSKFSITENGTVTYNQLSAGNTTITVTHKLTGITATRVIESGMEWESSTYLVEDFGENNLFLNVNDDTANVDQYDSTEKMCWIFDKVSGSNLYTIKNKYNNKYLGVENHAAVEGAKLVFYEDSTGASCKWLLSPYGNKEPSYRIASSQDPTLLLAFPPGTNFGDQVLLLPESKIYSKGWNLYLERYEKSMTVRNYYDDGYLTRATVDQIYSDFIETMRFYIKNWGIRLIMAETTYYDPDVTPASDGSYSKTALTNQFREDFGYGTYNDIKIYWSCYKIMNGSQLAYSHTVPEQYIIFMFEPEHENVSEQVAVKTFHRILIHEMYHQFGILDHYHETRQPLDENGKCKNNPRCKTCNIQSAYSEDCCMNSQSATKYKLFCNTCRT